MLARSLPIATVIESILINDMIETNSYAAKMPWRVSFTSLERPVIQREDLGRIIFLWLSGLSVC